MNDLSIGERQQHGHLTLFPLHAAGASLPSLTLLSDAIGAETLRITEVGQGSVPVLLAVNDGAADVLVLDGEQLIGAKQNRMTNRSLVLPAMSRTEIPVSCMEQGRWSSVSHEFSAAAQHSPSSVRRQAREVEAEGARAPESPPQQLLAQAQGRVWSAIAVNEAALGARSSTGALNDAYTARDADIGAWTAAFPLQQGQVGAVVCLAERVLAMDVVGCARLYARLHARLLRGYVVDALAAPGREASVPERVAADFVGTTRAAARTPMQAVGKGSYHVLAGPVVGAELLLDGRAVHLSAFPAPGDGRGGAPGGPGIESAPPIASPRQRRGYRMPLE